MTVLLLTMLLVASEEKSGLPDLEGIFLQNRRDDLARLLSEEITVNLDLNPLLFDHGSLSRQQVLMSFDKLQQQYLLVEARLTNSQSDTNYAWLEVYLDITLENKTSGLVYYATFAFHFKITGAQMVIGRWVLQDIH